jgi:hypothetical protein
VRTQLRFGAPLRFFGTGDESQQTISEQVDVVKASIAQLIAAGLEDRAAKPGA